MESTIDLDSTVVALQRVPVEGFKFTLLNSDTKLNECMHVQPPDDHAVYLFVGIKVLQLGWIDAIQACINSSSPILQRHALKRATLRHVMNAQVVTASFAKLQGIILSVDDGENGAPKEGQLRLEPESAVADSVLETCNLLDIAILQASRRSESTLPNMMVHMETSQDETRRRRGAVGQGLRKMPLLISCGSQLRQIKLSFRAQEDPKSGYFEPPSVSSMNENASKVVLLVDALDQAVGIKSETSGKCWWTASADKGLSSKEQAARLSIRLRHIQQRITLWKLLLLRQHLTDATKESTLIPLNPESSTGLGSTSASQAGPAPSITMKDERGSVEYSGDIRAHVQSTEAILGSNGRPSMASEESTIVSVDINDDESLSTHTPHMREQGSDRPSCMETDFHDILKEGWLQIQRCGVLGSLRRSIRRYFVCLRMMDVSYLAYSRGPGIPPVLDDKHSKVISKTDLAALKDDSSTLLLGKWILKADTKPEIFAWRSTLATCAEEHAKTIVSTHENSR